jgi:hypothetical protein
MPHLTDMSQTATVDGSPKWFTEVTLDLKDRWTESTIEYGPTLSYDDSAFTRVEIETSPTGFTPAPTPGG